MPGLDGSGDLFDGLLRELGASVDTEVLRYPRSASAFEKLAPMATRAFSESSPVVVVAESFSTPFAIEITAGHQREIHALVLCNGFATNPLSGFESLMASLLTPWLFRLPVTDLTARTFLVGRDTSAELVHAIKRAVLPIKPAVLCARLNAVLNCDARQALRQITVPVLYLQATRDRLIGPSSLELIRRIKPDIIVERIDGPHLLLQKEPKRCAEIILRFLDRIE
ncbi:MAG TPA: alpha/beta hydrolase [Terracidiphilus sp.]|jgi:pimeloyl-ACP methyl ester carboxylesterase|nr:alpha/beta hydrolase [Terracidiphilus sp.]